MTNEGQQPTLTNGDPPLEKLRFGRIQANMWENPSDKGPFYTVSFERRYQDAEGVWKSTQSFKLDDLLLLAKAADKAHDAVLYILCEERS